MFNLPNKRAKQREAAIQVRLREGFARSMRVRVDTELNRVAKRSAEGYIRGGRTAALDVLQSHQENLHKILVSTYSAVLTTFGMRSIEAADRKGRKRIEKKDAMGDLQAVISEWTAEVSALKAAEMTATTRKLITRALEEAFVEDISPGDVAKTIEKLLGGPSAKWRSKMIAKTEIHGASQRGILVGAQQIPGELVKEWVAFIDERTREDHFIVDGDVQAVDEKFKVGNSYMDHPGDPAGGADQVINCRCVLVFEEV